MSEYVVSKEELLHIHLTAELHVYSNKFALQNEHWIDMEQATDLIAN
jgi:hypothetical protein